jgi:hypothetical protein
VTPAPRLSVTVLADRHATIERLIDHLHRQSIAGEIELVVACPSRDDFELPIAPTGLAAVRLVESPLLPMGEARAAAVRNATAPVVVLGETHAFPAPDWAELLLAAHESAWVGVAPGLENANPAGALSWSGFLMDYGRWLADSQAGGEIAFPPTYNAAWKREALIGCGDRLSELLEPGMPLDAALAARGGRFSHAPSARVAHLNIAHFRPWAAERYAGGRLLAVRRSRRWPRARRFIYFGGSFLVPLIRLVRTRPAAKLARHHRRLPRGTMAAVAVGSTLWALGEAVGYLAGAGKAEARMLEYETHKERYA